MRSVQERLVRLDDKLILLLTPPFSDGPLDPGYIKGYLPGIRENGAQYTHAATWVVQAIARLGQGRLAFELFQILNPIHHGRNEEEVARYKVEPYVVAGDVFSQPPHVGRGDWTWYTGSAGWLYRTGIESMLGLRRSGSFLTFDPCIPPQWPGFTLTYRYQSTHYRVAIENPNGAERGVAEVWLDGQRREDLMIPLADDQQTHEARVVMGDS
jgi:cyclic beta-1,2-glucan synthetase